MLFRKIWCYFVCIIFRFELSFEKAQQFADVYAHVLYDVERCYCAWMFSNRMDKVHGCLGDAVGCVLSSWSRIHIVDHTMDIAVSFLKMFDSKTWRRKLEFMVQLCEFPLYLLPDFQLIKSACKISLERDKSFFDLTV